MNSVRRPHLWLPALGLLGLLAPGPAAPHVVETFDRPPQWRLVEPWQVVEGRLTVTVDGQRARLFVPGTAALVDYKVRVRLVERSADAGRLRVGLSFRASDPDNGFFVLLGDDGAYWVGSLVGGKAVPALTGAVPELAGRETLTLTVICQGDRQTILINDQRLVSRPATAYASGGIALLAEGRGRAAFDDLWLGDVFGVPDGEAVTPPVTPITPLVQPPRLGPTPTPGAPETGEPGPTAPVEPTTLSPLEPGPVAPAPEAEPLRPRVLFAETFNPPRYGWPEDAFRRIVDGELTLKATAGYRLSGFARDWGDMVAQVKARPLAPGGGTYGLVARLQADGQSGYLLVLKDPDEYAVARLDQGRTVLLQRGRVAVPPGWKRLEIECRGAQLTCRVNGSAVASFTDSTYPRGGLGVWVDDHRQAAFDDLLATELPPLPAPEPLPTVRRTLLEERFDPPQLDWRQDAQRRLLDGQLVLSSLPGRFTVSGAPETRTGDYEVTVDATRRGGPEHGLIGLLVRLQADGRSGYLLACQGTGRVLLLRLDPAGAVELARAEAPGGVVRRLRLTADGPALVAAVDGRVVAQVEDAVWPTGGYGVYVDQGVEAGFDNLLAVALRELP